jgi:hypothetical protein
MSSLDSSNQLAVTAPGILSLGIDAVQNGMTPYSAAAEEAAAALVHISGASSITVDEFEAGIPPNLAAATSLVNQVASDPNVSEAAFGSLYTLMDSGAAFALTRE